MIFHGTTVILDTSNGVFGDGTHGSTLAVLDALYLENPKDKLVLDIGTGSGIQSIFAKKWGAKDVLAVDVEYSAILAARHNFEKNKVNVRSKLNIFNEDLGYEADIMVANLSAAELHGFLPIAKNTLKREGVLICSFPKMFNFFNECDIHDYEVVRKTECNDFDAFTLKLK